MLGEAEAGWLGGEFNGKKGWFPQNYVTVLPVSHTEVTAMAVSSAAVQTRLQSADSTTSFQPTSFSRDRSSLVDRDTHFVPTAVPQTSPPKVSTSTHKHVQSNVTYPTTSGPGPCWITEYIG